MPIVPDLAILPSNWTWLGFYTLETYKTAFYTSGTILNSINTKAMPRRPRKNTPSKKDTHSGEDFNNHHHDHHDHHHHRNNEHHHRDHQHQDLDQDDHPNHERRQNNHDIHYRRLHIGAERHSKKKHIAIHSSGSKHDSNSDEDSKEKSTEDDTSVEYSLSANELNNTKKADVELIFFNRVPKVGSQSLMHLMARLGQMHGYDAGRDPGKRYETVLIEPRVQKSLITDVLSMEKPRVYSQHIAYINFTRFHRPKPIYINLVRHPIERVISWHYYIRAEWYYIDMKKKLGDKAPPRPSDEFMNMDLETCVKIDDKMCRFHDGMVANPSGDHRRQTLFFCGQNKELCMPFNSAAAMQKAKRTVEEDYAVVGTWEDTNITLTVLEHYIPRFFKHAKLIYYLGKDRLSRINKNPVKRQASQEIRDLLSKNFTHEIEFYEFCKQRLYLQYAAISGNEKIDNDDYILIPEHQDEDEFYDEEY